MSTLQNEIAAVNERFATNKAELAKLRDELEKAGYNTGFSDTSLSFWKPSKFRIFAAIQRLIHGPGCNITLHPDGTVGHTGLGIQTRGAIKTIDEMRSVIACAFAPTDHHVRYDPRQQ